MDGAVNLQIPTLGDKFQDYREDIPGDSFKWGPVIQADKVKYFAFHHSVTEQTAKNDGNWKAECNKIAEEHLAEGWGGVGYRFIICSDGTVAYVGDLSHGGSAVAGNNDIILSACLVGDFTKELPTAAQIDSAWRLAQWFLNNMPQYPLINNDDSIIGHRDAAELLKLPGATSTACPGPAWRDPNDSLRTRILINDYKGYPDPQPAGVQQQVQENISGQVENADNTQQLPQTEQQNPPPIAPVENPETPSLENEPATTQTPLPTQEADPQQPENTDSSVPSTPEVAPTEPDPSKNEQTLLDCQCVGCKTIFQFLQSFFQLHEGDLQKDLAQVKKILGL